VRDHLGFPAICGPVDAAVEHFAPSISTWSRPSTSWNT
jgi:hypothetical protein